MVSVQLGEQPQPGLAQYARECRESLPEHSVLLEVEELLRQIGVGPITGSIHRAWVEYDGQEVTEVPEGESFDVKVNYSAQNPGANDWATAVTAMSTDGAVSGHDLTHISVYSSFPTTATIHNLGPMPGHDITLRVKLWGNQEWLGVSPPPVSDW